MANNRAVDVSSLSLATQDRARHLSATDAIAHQIAATAIIYKLSQL